MVAVEIERGISEEILTRLGVWLDLELEEVTGIVKDDDFRDKKEKIC